MEADFGLTDYAMNEHNRHKGDENLYVKFFTHPLQNKEKTLEEGRPIYEDKEFVSIMVPGDKHNIVTRESRKSDIQRFPKQYQNYKNDNEELIDGTPLEKWPLITPGQVLEMKYFNVRTVEQLAGLNDSTAQKFMGINLLRQRAKEYLVAAKDAAPVTQLQGELAKRDEEIDAMKNSMEEMRKELAGMKKAKK